MKKFVIFVLMILLSGCQSIKFTGYGTQNSYSQGSLYSSTYISNTPSIRAYFDINDLVNIKTHKGKLQITFEGFVSYIHRPKTGTLSGICSLLRYSYPFNEEMRGYLEGGAGPTYLSIKTNEQGHPGFNFIDQIGSGIEYKIFYDASLTLGYRYSHISHANLRSSNNSGINVHSVVLGIIFEY